MIAVAALCVAAGGYWWFFVQNEQSEKMTTTSAAPQFVAFKDIIVNLYSSDDAEDMHFMQIDIALMTRSKPTYKALNNNLPVVRSALLDLLATWNFEQIQKPENRAVLRKQIFSRLRELPSLQSQGIEDVLITNLVVQ